MMPRTARDVFALRRLVLTLLRAGSVVLVAWGAFLVFHRVLFAGLSGMGVVDMLQTWEGIGEQHGFYRGVGLVVVGGVLAGTSGVLARWIVAYAPYCCPSCGYGVPKVDDAARCPECGVPEVFARQAPEDRS
ncbi:MAG: hypothetical protein SFY69_06925 [Planctomycetota bacterium]|nr:hypothetical protein [Planctomycetota bacterium]